MTYNFASLNNSVGLTYDERRTTCSTVAQASLPNGQSCNIVYRFTPKTEWIKSEVVVNPVIKNMSNQIATGSAMQLNVYSRIPTDKPTGSYLKSCSEIIWLNGVFSATCPNSLGKSTNSKLEYFKACNRKVVNTEVTTKDGTLVCVDPL